MLTNPRKNGNIYIQEVKGKVIPLQAYGVQRVLGG
jgi:hypothetical protein